MEIGEKPGRKMGRNGNLEGKTNITKNYYELKINYFVRGFF